MHLEIIKLLDSKSEKFFLSSFGCVERDFGFCVSILGQRIDFWIFANLRDLQFYFNGLTNAY
jgi:hypothetical protein